MLDFYNEYESACTYIQPFFIGSKYMKEHTVTVTDNKTGEQIEGLKGSVTNADYLSLKIVTKAGFS